MVLRRSNYRQVSGREGSKVVEIQVTSPLKVESDPSSRLGATRPEAENASVAQWIEYCPPKARVAGSIPARRANP